MCLNHSDLKNLNSIYSCRWTEKNSSLVKYNKPISTEILKFFKILEMLKSGPLIWIKLIVWLSAYLPVSDLHVIMTKILPFSDLVLLIADHDWKMFLSSLVEALRLLGKKYVTSMLIWAGHPFDTNVLEIAITVNWLAMFSNLMNWWFVSFYI